MKKWIRIIMVMVAVCSFVNLKNPVCRAEEEHSDHKENAKICRVCGMYIERFARTAVYVDYKDGKSEAYCGVSCAIRSINERGGMDTVKSARVTGWITENPVDMKAAAYVIGSRLVPDMVPNIIAFDSEEEAKEFMAKNGGKIESLDVLLVKTSYRALTAPFRIPAAAVPSQGVLMAGAGASVRHMDGLLAGDDKITDSEAFATRTSIMDKMTTYMFSQVVGYGITEDLFCSLNVSYAKKKLTAIAKSNGSETVTRNEGITDVPLTARWRFWHDTYYDKHLGVLGAVTFPTGDYDSTIRSMSSLQMGNGAPGFTLGPLYSHHAGKFWFHVAGTYKWNLENSDDYKFADVANYGFAVHYLPNTSDILGFELDGESCLKNKFNGTKVLNTGRTALYYNFIYQRKVLLLLGGNVNASCLFGMPAYESVKDIQLGEKYHAGASIQWQRKF
ncbi:MAG: nitrous oxide reductase accessory protein NosL [Candidatus Omnitrophota bacterium]